METLKIDLMDRSFLKNKMTKKCTQCKVEQGDDQFICKNDRITLTCSRCRNRSLRCNNKNRNERIQMSENWKNNNKEYIKLYNEFYRNHANLPQEERELILQEIKKLMASKIK